MGFVYFIVKQPPLQLKIYVIGWQKSLIHIKFSHVCGLTHSLSGVDREVRDKSQNETYHYFEKIVDFSEF